MLPGPALRTGLIAPVLPGAMDQQGMEWRNYHEINFVNILYEPFDASGWEPRPSGLLGPVRLEPVSLLKPE